MRRLLTTAALVALAAPAHAETGLLDGSEKQHEWPVIGRFAKVSSGASEETPAGFPRLSNSH
jgi:hypothetical protein